MIVYNNIEVSLNAKCEKEEYYDLTSDRNVDV